MISRRNFGLALSSQLLLFGLGLGVLTSLKSPAPARLRVVTTVPDLADIARAIGGPDVKVHSICRGKENLHAASPRPSDLIALSKADLFIQLGLSAETTWLPSLLNRARNRTIASGAEGFVNASRDWQAIQIPDQMTRSLGDIHPQGNPHFNLDPRAGAHMAAKILEGFVRIDPAGEAEYKKRLDTWLKSVDEARERWAEIGAQFKGKRVVIYHMEFNYFAEHYGIEIVGSLEPRPGIPPTPNHLAKLIKTMQDEKIEVLLTAPWSNNRFVKDVAKKTGARVILLPTMVEEDIVGGWIGMMDVLHERLAQAFGIQLPETAEERE